jgi:hypothetical protein
MVGVRHGARLKAARKVTWHDTPSPRLALHGDQKLRNFAPTHHVPPNFNFYGPKPTHRRRRPLARDRLIRSMPRCSGRPRLRCERICKRLGADPACAASHRYRPAAPAARTGRHRVCERAPRAHVAQHVARWCGVLQHSAACGRLHVRGPVPEIPDSRFIVFAFKRRFVPA